MYNEDLLKKLISDFGETNAILYCKMESAKNSYLFDECVKQGDSCIEYEFERDWWKSAETKMSDNIKNLNNQ